MRILIRSARVLTVLLLTAAGATAADTPSAVRWALSLVATTPMPMPDGGALLMLGITGAALLVNRKQRGVRR